ncbi:hypothetical protein [Pseudactinotalea sp. Z1748]
MRTLLLNVDDVGIYPEVVEAGIDAVGDGCCRQVTSAPQAC